MHANVLVSTAWPTNEDGLVFSQVPHEPNMDTLMYWVSHLENLIRSESGEVALPRYFTAGEWRQITKSPLMSEAIEFLEGC